MTAHRHAHLDESTLQGIDRPPDVTVEQVVLVRFRRGEGCCDLDIVRECMAVYSMDGDLLAVVDPTPRTRLEDRP